MSTTPTKAPKANDYDRAARKADRQELRILAKARAKILRDAGAEIRRINKDILRLRLGVEAHLSGIERRESILKGRISS